MHAQYKQLAPLSAHQQAHRKQLPGKVDGLLLEVVPEGPVAQHLEEGVVVHILANVIKVIVLATSTYALQQNGTVGPSEGTLRLLHQPAAWQ